MFSEDGEVAGERLDAHVDEVETFISAASAMTRFGLSVALFFIRLSPILFLLRLTTLERLAITERAAILARLETSTRATTLSLAFVGWRTILTLVFYEDESELARLGYRTERQRYKRALPMLAAEHLPSPLESGVRLRDPDQTPLPASGAKSRDVA